MDMQSDKIKSKAKILLQKASEILREKSEWIIPIVFLVSMVYSVFLWYSYAFNPNWSDAKKSEYIRTKQKDITFNKDKFDSVILEIKERKVNYQKNLESIPNVFRFK